MYSEYGRILVPVVLRIVEHMAALDLPNALLLADLEMGKSQFVYATGRLRVRMYVRTGTSKYQERPGMTSHEHALTTTTVFEGIWGHQLLPDHCKRIVVVNFGTAFKLKVLNIFCES